MKATAAIIGAAALMFGGAALPANATSQSSGTPVSIFGADKYELASNVSGMSVDELRQLEADGSIEITDEGFVLFIDEATDTPAPSPQLRAVAPEGFQIPGNPVEGSKPDAPVTLAITFDGVTMEHQRWNEEAELDTLTFSAAAGLSDDLKHEIWARVAEQYAPFNVNVITGVQPDDVMHKSSFSDTTYGALAVVTDSPSTLVTTQSNLAGIAWMGGTGSAYLEGALVFASAYAAAPDEVKARAFAETIAHEVGHNFGLGHHGFEISPIAEDEYYTPMDGVWGPVMGISDFTPLSQWSDGSYAHATNSSQGDLEKATDRSGAQYFFSDITLPGGGSYDTSNGACSAAPIGPGGLQPGDMIFAINDQGNCDPVGPELTIHWEYIDRADMASDTVGNTFADATRLDNSTSSFGTDGIIVSRGDQDMYSVVTGGGTFIASVEVANQGPSLNAQLTLFDAAGSSVAVSTQVPERVTAFHASGLGAQIEVQLDAGLYYLAVDGVGTGDPSQAIRTNAFGFSDYASVGNYQLTGTAAPLNSVTPVTVQQPAGGTEVTTGTPVRLTGTAEPRANIEISVGGVVVSTASANATGAWESTLTPAIAGPMHISVAQIIGGFKIAETAELTLQAVAPKTDGGTTPGGNTPPATGNTSTGAKGIAHTGASTGSLPFVIAASVLLLAGGSIIWVKRRRTA